jgi:LytS/YehU family sensor histidine kinase
LYLDIEKVRFGHRLATHIDSVEELQKLVLPSLLLQPIVENAIKFGLYDTTEKVLIEVTTALQNKELIISVKNPFDAATAVPRKGTGFGLSSVNRRLYLLYGRTDLLKTHSENAHFITTINIPQA